MLLYALFISYAAWMRLKNIDLDLVCAVSVGTWSKQCSEQVSVLFLLKFSSFAVTDERISARSLHPNRACFLFGSWLPWVIPVIDCSGRAHIHKPTTHTHTHQYQKQTNKHTLLIYRTCITHLFMFMWFTVLICRYTQFVYVI